MATSAQQKGLCRRDYLERMLDYSGEPNLITQFLKAEKPALLSHPHLTAMGRRNLSMKWTHYAIPSFEDGGRGGHELRNMGSS